MSVQARGWSLLHVAACLASPAALTFLLTQGSLSPNGGCQDKTRNYICSSQPG